MCGVLQRTSRDNAPHRIPRGARSPATTPSRMYPRGHELHAPAHACYAMLGHAMPCQVMLCHAILSDVMPCDAPLKCPKRAKQRGPKNQPRSLFGAKSSVAEIGGGRGDDDVGGARVRLESVSWSSSRTNSSRLGELVFVSSNVMCVLDAHVEESSGIAESTIWRLWCTQPLVACRSRCRAG